MAHRTIDSRALLEPIERAFEAARGAWIGCDWPTTFGQTGLDLNGISSAQALLMARATAGQEAADWRDAAEWLRQIEADAAEAEDAAMAALDHAGQGDLDLALQEVSFAIGLEARYHSNLIWAEFRDEIVAWRARENA